MFVCIWVFVDVYGCLWVYCVGVYGCLGVVCVCMGVCGCTVCVYDCFLQRITKEYEQQKTYILFCLILSYFFCHNK